MEKWRSSYVITGQLVFDTAFHLGGGLLNSVNTDAPVVRTPAGQPYIPGSSFKGTFRSAVEKIAGNISGIKVCFLADDTICLSPQGESQKIFNQQRSSENWDDQHLVEELAEQLCDICQLFGSPYQAGKILFSDLYLSANTLALSQIRDGVAIDRDSERAVPSLKYDYEVVVAGSVFDLRINLENPSERQLGLVSLGLSELLAGEFWLGGKKSAGLGRCHLDNLQIFVLDLSNPNKALNNLQRYLLGRSLSEKMELIKEPGQFIAEKIKNLLGVVRDAQASGQ
ncbi:putative CRISPR-associated RAMP protein [anaerobic digester metagenome]|uniref:Putative CRISPR-associated RAMP protein n=1 Tax=anaerobic digester metagenome TaxID=1263854 RepID=A0A485M661_9ZZZZ